MVTRTAPDFRGLGRGGPRLDPRVGTALQMLVLADNPGHLVGIELHTGALVRAWYDLRLRESALPTYGVALARLSGNFEIVPDPTEPEALVLSDAPSLLGSLHPKRAEQLLRPLLHPQRVPLLGCQADAVRFWERDPDNPSVGVVETPGQVLVLREEGYLCCRFFWAGGVRELPCVDQQLEARMIAADQEELGLESRTRLVVTFSRPTDGRCRKQVEAVLPRL